MNKVLKAYYKRLKNEPCLVCGVYGVDVAHLRPISPKTRTWSTRSHKDYRAFVAIPLCRKHHAAIHTFGEQWLDIKLDGGRAKAYAWSLGVLGRVILDECKDEA